MPDRPILMSSPMVRALLAGTKTQTRRIVKNAPPEPELEAVMVKGELCFGERGAPGEPSETFDFRYGEEGDQPAIRCPYGVPGDRLIPAMEIPSLGRNYCADVFGHIWSRARDGRTWAPLKGTPNSKGYMTVTPAVGGRYPTRFIHALVIEAFYGAPPAGLDQIRHLNGEQNDNAPENLDWGSQEDNWSDRLSHGRRAGEDHHAAKLTEAAVAEIRTSARSQRALAERFGVAQSTIWEVRQGMTWAQAPVARPPNLLRWASRLTLTITDVRVERLQDISEADAEAEGVESPASDREDRNWSICPECGGTGLRGALGPNLGFMEVDCIDCDTFAKRFKHLWNHINGENSWSENPWIWVVAFEVIR